MIRRISRAPHCAGVESNLPEGSSDLAVSQEIKRLQSVLRKLAQEQKAPVEVVEIKDARKDPIRTNWIIRVDKDQSFVVPTPSLANSGEKGKSPVCYGPMPDGAGSSDWLAERFNRIARAQSLINVVKEAPFAQDLQLELLLHDYKKGPDGNPKRPQNDDDPLDLVNGADGRPIFTVIGTEETPELHHLDPISFRFRNTGNDTLDVTLLEVDSDYGIATLFPSASTTTDNILAPKAEITTLPDKFDAETDSVSHLIVIAIKSRPGQPLDFSLFDQPSLEKIKDANPQGRGQTERGASAGSILRWVSSCRKSCFREHDQRLKTPTSTAWPAESSRSAVFIRCERPLRQGEKLTLTNGIGDSGESCADRRMQDAIESIRWLTAKTLRARREDAMHKRVRASSWRSSRLRGESPSAIVERDRLRALSTCDRTHDYRE